MIYTNYVENAVGRYLIEGTTNISFMNEVANINKVHKLQRHGNLAQSWKQKRSTSIKIKTISSNKQTNLE